MFGSTFPKGGFIYLTIQQFKNKYYNKLNDRQPKDR